MRIKSVYCTITYVNFPPGQQQQVILLYCLIINGEHLLKTINVALALISPASLLATHSYSPASSGSTTPMCSGATGSTAKLMSLSPLLLTPSCGCKGTNPPLFCVFLCSLNGEIILRIVVCSRSNRF